MQRASVYWKWFLSFTHWNVLRSDTTVDNRSLLHYEFVFTYEYLCVCMCTMYRTRFRELHLCGAKKLAFSTGLLPFSGWRLLLDPLTHRTCCCQVLSFSWEGDRMVQRIACVSNWATFHRKVRKWALAYLDMGLSFLGGQWSLEDWEILIQRGSGKLEKKTSLLPKGQVSSWRPGETENWIKWKWHFICLAIYSDGHLLEF